MYYKIDSKKFKKLIGNSLFCEDISKEDTPETFSLKEIDKISLNDIENFDRENGIPSFKNASILAKEIQVNGGGQEDLIKIKFVEDKYIFQDWHSLGQYLGQLATNAQDLVVESELPILGFEEINNSEVRMLLKDNYKVSWEIPKDLVVNSWADAEFVLNKFKNLSSEDSINESRNIPDSLLEDKDFLINFLSLPYTCYSIKNLIDEGRIERKTYLELCANNPKAFSVQLNGFMGDIITSTSRLITDILEADKLVNHPTSEFHNVGVINEENIKRVGRFYNDKDVKNRLDDLADVLYLEKNVFSNKDKMIELVHIRSGNLSRIDFEDIVEIGQLATVEIQCDEDFRKVVKSAHDNSKRGFDRMSIVCVTPPEYLDTKEKTVKFIRSVLRTEDDNPRQVFPKYILDKFTSDLDSVCRIVDESIELKGKSFTDNLLHLIKESAPLDVQIDREFFKRLVLADNWSFPHYTVYASPEFKPMAKAYKDYILNDEEMFSYIIKHANPKTIGSLPVEFIKKIEDEKLLASIVASTPSLLEQDSELPELRTNIRCLVAARNNISRYNIKKSEITQAIQKVEDAVALAESCPTLFKKFPAEYKSDYMVSLTAVLNEYDNISEINPSLLLNKDFCISLLNENHRFERVVPKSFFTDKEFILKVFKGLDDGSLNSVILSSFPKEVTICLSAFDVSQGNYESFGNSFFVSQKLSNTLEANENLPKRKIKI